MLLVLMWMVVGGLGGGIFSNGQVSQLSSVALCWTTFLHENVAERWVWSSDISNDYSAKGAYSNNLLSEDRNLPLTDSVKLYLGGG